MCITEEVPVCGIEIAQCTLQRLRIDFSKPLMLRLQLTLHAIGQFDIADRLLFLPVGFNLHVERPVVDKAAAAEGLCKQDLLVVCRVYSVFIGSQHDVLY